MQQNEGKKQLMLLIPVGIHADLKKQSLASGVSMTQIVVNALKALGVGKGL